MKWGKARKHCSDYYAWQDLSHVMFVTLVIAVVASLVIALLVILMAPRQATAGDVTNFRVARRLAPPALRLDVVTTRRSVFVATIYCEISAYSPSVAETDANPHRTASGKHVYVGGIASDWSVLPLGSIVTVPGYNGGRPCQVVDTGGSIKGNKLDVFMWSEYEAIHWGRRRNVKVQVLYRPKVNR